MIEEREILVSRILKAAYAASERANQREHDFEKTFLSVIAVFCIAKKAGKTEEVFSDELIEKTRGILSSTARDEETLLKQWEASIVDIARELDAELHPEVVLQFSLLWDLLTILDGHDSDVDLYLYIYDVVFRRYIASENPIDFRLSHKISGLAAELGATRTNICDYFLETGDLAVSLYARREQMGTVKTYQLMSDEFLIRLRLSFYGVRLQPEDWRTWDSSRAAEFVLVNYPYQGTTSESALKDDERPYDANAIEALDRMLKARYKFGSALVVVAGADRTAKRTRLVLRRHLVQQNLLRAVIDISYYDKYKKRAESVSAWFLSSQKKTDEVLFVDTARLDRMDKTADSTGSMWFVGHLIRSYINPSPTDPQIITFEGATELAGLFLHEFRDGYKDLETICRSVNLEEIRKNNWELRAGAYIAKEAGKEPHLATIDSVPILDLLDRIQTAPVRTYVIGNNGQGKSLLLRELVAHLCERKQKTIGISFGVTDRFPFQKIIKSKRNQADSLFMYLGARTKPDNVGVKDVNRSLAALATTVHVEQVRLDFFNELLKLLGFRASHYFIPVELDLSLREMPRDQLSDVILLSNNAVENRQLIESAESKAFKLGLVRKDLPGVVTPFDELSSGEQQIISLAIKLAACANADTVLLIDEPEISLHVSWQKSIPTILKLASEKLGCSAVVATHSPVVISSAVVLGEHCFSAENRQLRRIPAVDGRSVENILFDGFRTYTENNRTVHETCAAVVAEAIDRLNSGESESASFEDLFKRLDQMTRIIAATEDVRAVHRNSDLTLIDSARAAITEVQANAD